VRRLPVRALLLARLPICALEGAQEDVPLGLRSCSACCGWVGAVYPGYGRLGKQQLDAPTTHSRYGGEGRRGGGGALKWPAGVVHHVEVEWALGWRCIPTHCCARSMPQGSPLLTLHASASTGRPQAAPFRADRCFVILRACPRCNSPLLSCLAPHSSGGGSSDSSSAPLPPGPGLGVTVGDACGDTVLPLEAGQRLCAWLDYCLSMTREAVLGQKPSPSLNYHRLTDVFDSAFKTFKLSHPNLNSESKVPQTLSTSEAQA
jgi:hypothetical protein